MPDQILTDRPDIVWVGLDIDQVNALVGGHAVRLDINADLIKGTPETIIMLRGPGGGDE